MQLIINVKKVKSVNQSSNINYRLLAAPLVIEGREKTTTLLSSVSGTLTLASLEIVECLIDSNSTCTNGTPPTEYVELLTFAKEGSTNFGFTNKTDFKMKFKHVVSIENTHYVAKCAHPRTNIE